MAISVANLTSSGSKTFPRKSSSFIHLMVNVVSQGYYTSFYNPCSAVDDSDQSHCFQTNSHPLEEALAPRLTHNTVVLRIHAGDLSSINAAKVGAKIPLDNL